MTLFLSLATTATRGAVRLPTAPAMLRCRSAFAATHQMHRRCAHVRASVVETEATEGTVDVPLESEFLKTMKWRGFLQQATDIASLDAKLKEGPVVAYLGFDATASSLHVGSLLQIMLLRHFQRCGHKPIVLVGGGTTKVGDPSGKDASRQMLTEEKIGENIQGIVSVFEKFLKFGDGPSDALLVNNDEWLSSLQYLDFLREYGRHFSINRMLTFESVKQRLERESPVRQRRTRLWEPASADIARRCPYLPRGGALCRPHTLPLHFALTPRTFGLLSLLAYAPRLAALLPRVQLHDPPGVRFSGALPPP